MTNQALSIAVLSGKGGVGKSGIALNLAYLLQSQGDPCLLVDCDMGLANLDVMLGVSPSRNLRDLILSDLSLEDVLVPVLSGSLDLLPAASGMADLVDLDEDSREALLGKLESRLKHYGFVILDLPAGISETVLSLSRMARMRIVVITPEPTSLTDAYAVIKVLHNRFGMDDFKVVVNMAESPQESEESFRKLNAACRQFLSFEVDFLGSISRHPSVRESVRLQAPFAQSHPEAPPTQELTQIAREVRLQRKSMLPQLVGRTALIQLD